MILFIQIFSGILLCLLPALGRKTLRAASYRSSNLRRIVPFMPAGFFIVWVLYAFWILRSWFSSSAMYPMILFFSAALLIILFSWYILRDIVAGLVASGRKQFHIDHRICLNELSGKIIEKGIAHITVRTDDGNIARIPYSRIIGEVVPERSEDTASDYYRIHLSIPKNNTPEQLQTILTRDVRSIPWVLPGAAPVVQLKDQTEDACNFEVLIQSLNSRHAARVESILKAIYENRKSKENKPGS